MKGRATRGRCRQRPCAYYVCFSRQRYGKSTCDGDRLPADELEEAILAQLLSVLEREPLVREAISSAFEELEPEQPRREAELSHIDAEAKRVDESLDRYFRAFEEIRVVSRAEIYPSFLLPAVRPPGGSAPRAGFEPAAYSLGGSRSIRLSYRGSRQTIARVRRPRARVRTVPGAGGGARRMRRACPPAPRCRRCARSDAGRRTGRV